MATSTFGGWGAWAADPWADARPSLAIGQAAALRLRARSREADGLSRASLGRREARRCGLIKPGVPKELGCPAQGAGVGIELIGAGRNSPSPPPWRSTPGNHLLATCKFGRASHCRFPGTDRQSPVIHCQWPAGLRPVPLRPTDCHPALSLFRAIMANRGVPCAADKLHS